MQRLFEFLTAHWDTLAGYAGSVAGIAGWLAERNKRMLDRRDSDVAFWKTTIEAQNEQIKTLRSDVAALEAKYDLNNTAQLKKIKDLTEQVEELTERLEKYEPERKRTKTHTTKNA